MELLLDSPSNPLDISHFLSRRRLCYPRDMSAWKQGMVLVLICESLCVDETFIGTVNLEMIHIGCNRSTQSRLLLKNMVFIFSSTFCICIFMTNVGKMQAVLSNHEQLQRGIDILNNQNQAFQLQLIEVTRLFEQTTEMLHRLHTENFSTPTNCNSQVHLHPDQVSLACDLVYSRSNTLITVSNNTPQSGESEELVQLMQKAEVQNKGDLESGRGAMLEQALLSSICHSNQEQLQRGMDILNKQNQAFQLHLIEVTLLFEQTTEMLHRLHTENFSTPTNCNSQVHLHPDQVLFACDLVYSRNNTLITVSDNTSQSAESEELVQLVQKAEVQNKT